MKQGLSPSLDDMWGSTKVATRLVPPSIRLKLAAKIKEAMVEEERAYAREDVGLTADCLATAFRIGTIRKSFPDWARGNDAAGIDWRRIMCGILGLIERRRLVNEELFLLMRDTLAHRGPDAAGFECDRTNQVALGHRRLSIIDMSKVANRPMASADGSPQIVFNGEIYNYIELRDQLAQLGSVFHTHSDTEVLLEAFRVWGKDAPARLNGMFAFLIWDERCRQMFVARDRFGEKLDAPGPSVVPSALAVERYRY
jgi:hypothetical protein